MKDRSRPCRAGGAWRRLGRSAQFRVNRDVIGWPLFEPAQEIRTGVVRSTWCLRRPGGISRQPFQRLLTGGAGFDVGPEGRGLGVAQPVPQQTL
jgi:hypothetical protein